MQDWKIFKVGDFGKIITGKTPKTSNSEYYGGSIPFLTPSDDMEIKHVTETKRTLTALGKSTVKNFCLPSNSVCVSCIGSDLGKVVITTQETFSNQQINSIIIDEKFFDVDFVYYSMIILGKKLKYLSHTSTAVPIINKSTFSNFEIKVPPLEVQKKIATVLSSLDDKIELNNKINKNLEQQAQAIFKNFFITNFNPAWKVGKLEDIAEIIMGQSPSGKSYNANKVGSIFFQGRTDFGFRFPKIRMFTTEPKKFAKKGDILLSVRAPVGDYNVAIDDCCIGRGLAAIFSKKNNNSFLLYTISNLQKKFNIFNGQGTVFGAINQKELKNIEIFIPEQKIIDDFEKIVSPMDKFIFEKHLESLNLAEMRDLLLPRLLNGEIDVSKVEI